MPPTPTPQPPPVAQLDPTGKPSILSYNVPEETSYTGRGFLDLGIDGAWFKPLTAETPAPKPQVLLNESGGAAAGPPTYEVVRADGVYGLGEVDELQADSSLRPVTQDVVRALERAGRTPRFYRSLYGNLSVVAEAAPVPGTEPDTPSGGSTPAAVQLTIDSHQDGGGVDGEGSVTLALHGRAWIGSGTGAIASVQVKVGDAEYKPATSGDGWLHWTYSEVFTSSVVVGVTVLATHTTKKVTAKRVITVNIGVTPGPGSTDKTPPTVKITSPAESEIVEAAGSEPTNVEVFGTAADDQKVDAVEVVADDGLIKAPASPTSGQDWSSWKAVLPLGLGDHRLTAKCTDSSGNAASAGVDVKVSQEPPMEPLYTRLMLVESYRLSSYLGDFGAGRTLKTFSLMAGETAKISISTYRRTTETAKSASSILDSFTSESAQEFEKSVEREQAYKQNYQDSFDYSVSGATEASWGWGSASLEGSVSGATNGTREEFTKNITKAVDKHAAKASAKREVQVETSHETTTATGEETAIERVLENINLSRTLNYAFRQLNQRYFSVVSLVDVRVGFAAAYLDEDGERRVHYREATIPQLDSFLQEVLIGSQWRWVRDRILDQLKNVLDYRDVRRSFVESVAPKDDKGNPVQGATYLRCKKDMSMPFEKAGFKVNVEGIVLRGTDNVVRTDGVIVEAVLGQGEALDAYSRQLQTEAVREQRLANDEHVLEVERDKLGLEIVRTKNAEMAKLYEQIYETNSSPERMLTEVAENGDSAQAEQPRSE